MTSVELDAIDLKILRELQRDGRMTNVELAERVGISAPPCLRRVRKLEEAGVIEGYHAMLNAPKLGFDLVAFCMIGLKRQSDSNLKAFAAATAGWSLVRQDGVGRKRLSAALRGQKPDGISGFRHRGSDGGRKCRYGAHHAHHPSGEARRSGGNLIGRLFVDFGGGHYPRRNAS